jgi:twitching motility protein PilT
MAGLREGRGIPGAETAAATCSPLLPGGWAVDVDALLRAAAEAGASDVHVAVEVPPVLRVHGALRRLDMPAVAAGEPEALLERLASPEQVERLQRCGEVDFSYSLPGVGRFRVAAYRQRGSVSLALRPIPWTVPQLEDLGAPPQAAELALRPHGLVLVAGRAGSGKSTTMAAMVDRINGERAAHVITLEDPVEFLHRHRRSIVNQREIGVDCPDFAQALRAAARSNPDVVVVGELRDAEATSLVLSAAASGQLVLAAVRQPDIAAALDFLVRLFPPEQQGQVCWQLAAVLQGALGQLLLPRADGAGRVAAYEVLLATAPVRTLLREGKAQQLPALMRAGARQGMCTLQAAWQALCAQGACDPELPPPLPAAVAGPAWGSAGPWADAGRSAPAKRSRPPRTQTPAPPA